MVLLSGEDEPSCKDYLESTDVLPIVQAAVEAMLKKYTETPAPTGDEKPPHPLVFLGEFLKRHNPQHNAAMAEFIATMRAQPGYVRNVRGDPCLCAHTRTAERACVGRGGGVAGMAGGAGRRPRIFALYLSGSRNMRAAASPLRGSAGLG